MKTEPRKEHEWLQRLVGAWRVEIEGTSAPDKPAEKSRGTEEVRALGDVWILAEGEGDMPGGGKMSSVMTLGFDPQTGRFIGTWIGSVMSHLWVYDGELDASGRVLTLNAEGPSMSGDGKMAKYQDVIEIKSEDYRTLTGRMLGDDGQWKDFMTAHYRRTK